MEVGVRWEGSKNSSTSMSVRLRVKSVWIGLAIGSLAPAVGQGQVRGVYPLGMSAVNSGIMPNSGFTYSNLFLFYSRGEFRDPQGVVIATGENSVMMDM